LKSLSLFEVRGNERTVKTGTLSVREEKSETQ